MNALGGGRILANGSALREGQMADDGRLAWAVDSGSIRFIGSTTWGGREPSVSEFPWRHA